MKYHVFSSTGISLNSLFMFYVWCISSAENRMFPIESQKGAIVIDFVQR